LPRGTIGADTLRLYNPDQRTLLPPVSEVLKEHVRRFAVKALICAAAKRRFEFRRPTLTEFRF